MVTDPEDEKPPKYECPNCNWPTNDKDLFERHKQRCNAPTDRANNGRTQMRMSGHHE